MNRARALAAGDADSAMRARRPRFRRRRFAARRRGAVMVLMAVLLPMLAILAAVAINSAHVQLTRTELMVATDAAARAGGRAFSELQSVDQAKIYAQVTGAMNRVAGEPLIISPVDDVDIQFGYSELTGGDYSRFGFEQKPTSGVRAGIEDANAIRINGRRDAGSVGGEVKVIFPSFVSQRTFEPSHAAVAMQVDRDISLVLDRSGSMTYADYNWPAGKSPWYDSTLRAGKRAGLLYNRGSSYYYEPGVNAEIYQDWVYEDYYGLGPAPPSPWESLVEAVDAFLNVLDTTPQNEFVSLSTYASDATLDLNLTNDYDAVRSTLDTLRADGATAIGEGIKKGWESLANQAYARPFAAKTMVVMTDGNHNSGEAPEVVAQAMMDDINVTIHTVTFGSGADQVRMEELAAMGGGLHYHAETGDELESVFQEIANNLPTILTD